jgi:hypothetical protein
MYRLTVRLSAQSPIVVPSIHSTVVGRRIGSTLLVTLGDR